MQLVPSHRRELQTAVSTSAGLTSALANTAVGRIVLAPGTYILNAELSITRSVVLEAAVAGSVVLDAQASSSSPRRVLNINPGSLGVVQLIGLNITRGYVQYVRVAETCEFPIAPMGDSRLIRWLFAGCWCLCPVWHSDHLIVHHKWEYSILCARSCSKVPIAPMGKLLTCLPRLTLAQLRTPRSTTVCMCNRDLQKFPSPRWENALLTCPIRLSPFYQGTVRASHACKLTIAPMGK
jgi:hypothetical protein